MARWKRGTSGMSYTLSSVVRMLTLSRSWEATCRVTPARRRGLAEEVADRIRDAIFTGVYAPGAQLREVELAHALEVSRGPVREALLRLESEGLVHSAWHRGTTVTALSPA